MESSDLPVDLPTDLPSDLPVELPILRLPQKTRPPVPPPTPSPIKQWLDGHKAFISASASHSSLDEFDENAPYVEESDEPKADKEPEKFVAELIRCLEIAISKKKSLADKSIQAKREYYPEYPSDIQEEIDDAAGSEAVVAPTSAAAITPTDTANAQAAATTSNKKIKLLLAKAWSKFKKWIKPKPRVPSRKIRHSKYTPAEIADRGAWRYELPNCRLTPELLTAGGKKKKDIAKTSSGAGTAEVTATADAANTQAAVASSIVGLLAEERELIEDEKAQIGRVL